MATLYVSQFAGAGIEGNVMTPAYKVPALNHQAVTFTSTQGRSTPFSGATRLVRVVADANCFVLFGGSTVTATTGGAGGTFLVANMPTDFWIDPAATTNVSAVL